MVSSFHPALHACFGSFKGVASRASLSFLLLFAVVPCCLCAQDAAPIARVEGSDISVQGGSVDSRMATIAPTISVSNGNVITVHSGQARMMLASGGEVDICGPAKMTLLQAGTSLTLALDFGHVRVALPASVDLRIFTPTIVATPIDIEGGTRDVTLGLELDDSLCILATSGAIQLEHQFTGEKLIVPQSGEFFLSEGKLVPVAGGSGKCQCAAMPPRVIPSPAPTVPDIGLALPQVTKAAPQPQSPAAAPEVVPSTEFSVPVHPDQERPEAAKSKNASTSVAPPSVPTYTVVAPLSFSAKSPSAPSDPTPDMVLLVREARVEPDYEFSGHVDAPEFAEALQNSLGEGRSARSQPGPEPVPKKRGFWARLKSIF